MTAAPSPRRAFSGLRRSWSEGRIAPALIWGLSILGLIMLFCLLGPLFIEPRDALVGSVLPRQSPSAEFWLGTDAQGRDMLTLLILATPNTLKIGLIAGALGVGFGTILGLIAGNFRGWADAVIRIVADAMMTIPAIAILVIIAGNIEQMTVEIMALVVASLAWMVSTRTVRAQVLTIRERSYIEVARVNGESSLEILFREIMPNLLPFIIASFVATVATAILAVIGLEALGLGAPQEMTLGNTIYWSQQSSALLRGMWWWWLPPIIVIALISLGLFLTSIGFDRFANPRLIRA
ncbi:ABC transporter permease [Roseisalinus antarcticus]|uniref:Glutathione transport system permease protein GsiD n=1 Tax=Roseisalinus antarcticus TaxID=254357 RepID=A0A1Y5U2N6_9RHOB|nr:ABC transporter permease [Roseisalinus antarcticus]SLN75375.1 Glutathione transport system permease protein GsiD [Roseisalinus antarcticus]